VGKVQAHPICKMWGRVHVRLAVALCVADFITFLAHRPACSTGNMLHNKPVPKFKALSADTCVKSGSGAVVEIAVTRPMVAPVLPRMEAPAAAGDATMIEAPGPQVLSCCLLC
jgi:hypothetical protein